MRGWNRSQLLDQLGARQGIRTTGTDGPSIDWSWLTLAEQQYLAQLAGKTRRLPTGRWDFSALDDAELDRFTALFRARRRSGDEG